MTCIHLVRSLILALAAMGATLTASSAAAKSDSYPSHPVKIIVPYPPGGPADIVARALSAKMGASMGQTFVVENRSGAGGNIGTEEVARAVPDGYTLLLGTNGPLVVNVSLYDKLPFNPLKDFAPISQVATIPLVLLAHPSVPVNSVQELIAYAKAHPGKLTYASSGMGSGGHLAGALLASMAGIDIIHVPYRGVAPATTDLLAGHVNFMVGGLLAALPSLKSGSLKALAVVTPQRSVLEPGIPTVAESGLPGFEIVSWYGVLAPGGTPKPIIDKLHDAIIAALQKPDVDDMLFKKGGLEKVAGTPQQFTATLQREIPQYARIVKLTGAKAN
ncbi:tripartite tricarboxylate transporter substrate binding protein [Paralcaligenes ginsengisoli]